MNRFFAFLFAFLLPAVFAAQTDDNPFHENRIYDNDIRSVQMRANNALLENPIIELKKDNFVTLDFDHLGGDLKNYVYTLVHCDSDWKVSDLQDNEYLAAFTEDRITSVEVSQNTLVNYTHYTLVLPNVNMRWTRSGNYALQVFDEDDDRRPVLVRRFLVLERNWKIEGKATQAVQVDKLFSHQELDFSILHEAFRINNPQKEVKAYVLQNFRWDRIRGPIAPRPFISQDEIMMFDFQNQIVFPAGKEWRFFDIRSFEYRGDGVRRVSELDDYYQVTLQTDRDRSGSNSYARTDDINGYYYIENRNPNQGLLQCDYARVLFSLAREQAYEDEDVYVYGQLSDWSLQPEFKMEYDEALKLYLCEPLLKQGFYNYEYRIVSRNTGAPDEEGVEGNWHETGNIYTILAYYRPFGERYDRLMAVGTVNSRNRQ